MDRGLSPGNRTAGGSIALPWGSDKRKAFFLTQTPEGQQANKATLRLHGKKYFGALPERGEDVTGLVKDLLRLSS